MRFDADVVVIGAGPAGATAAGLLAGWGHSVVLVHGESDAPSLAESLPASTKKLFKFLGQLDAVETAAFHPNFGNISRWAEQDAVTTTLTPGYHVSRSIFDRVLREHARSNGAVILNGHVRGVEFTSPVGLECVGAHDVSRCTGRFVLDCSGRAGVIARRGLRRTGTRYRTLALVAEWATDEWSDPERTHTLVQSYDRGWAWSIPLSATRRQCTVMIDADRTTIRKSRLERTYADELRRAETIGARLAGSTRTGPVWACDASTYDSLRASERDVFLVGDAASFVEVLSSGGVRKALSSAWTAAVVVNTCLTKPERSAAASSFFDRRERQVHAEYVQRSAALFRDAAAVYNDEFWGPRARAADAISDADTLSEFALFHDSDVRFAFEQLRDATRLNLVVDPHVTFENVPAIEGKEVVLREGIVIPGLTTPVRFAAGLNLPALVRIAVNCQDVPAFLATYERQVAPADPRDLLVALSFLVTHRILMRT